MMFWRIYLFDCSTKCVTRYKLVLQYTFGIICTFANNFGKSEASCFPEFIGEINPLGYKRRVIGTINLY